MCDEWCYKCDANIGWIELEMFTMIIHLIIQNIGIQLIIMCIVDIDARDE